MTRWLVVLLMLGTATAVATPLDKPAFTATPAELIASAKASPTTGPTAILRYDVHLELDGLGRRTRRTRFVYVVRAQSAVDGWGTLFHFYRPFFQDRPAVRVRVVAADGNVTKLDLSTVRDAPAEPNGDRRRIVIPIPKLAVGSIVEEEVTIRDRVPIHEGGGIERIRIGDVVASPVHVVIAAPVARKLQLRTRNVPASIAPRHEVIGATERWTYDLTLPATPEREPNSPTDVTPTVELWVGASSWNAVARDYRRAVDRRIAEGPVALPAELPTTPTLETVRAITGWVRRTVKFDGVDLRDSALVPSPPAATLKRASADAKDLGTLLVAALRRAKVRADLVVVASGPKADVDGPIGGLDEFGHVLVRARLANHDVWIEVTEPLAQAGQLAPTSRGRKALVIADDTTALVETPRSRSTDNVVHEVRTFEISEYGNSKVSRTLRATGAPDLELRRWIRDSPADEVEAQLRELASEQLLAPGFERYTTTATDDLATPFTVSMSANDSTRASTEREQLHAYLFPSDTTERLDPSAFDEEPRRSELVWTTPHVYEIENRLIIPDGFVLPTPAPASTRPIGAMSLTRTERLDGRTYVVEFRLDTGKPRLTPGEAQATATALSELELERVDISLDLTAVDLEHQGKFKQAIAELERLSRLHPKEALHHSQLAQIYLRAGMGTAARRTARKGVQTEPTSADAQVVLGWMLRHDSVGREFGYDHDRRGALAAYQRARVLDPEHTGAVVDYATLLQTSTTGRQYDRDADVRAAVPQWRSAHALEPVYALDLVKALLHTEQFTEAEQIALAAPQDDARDMLLIAAIAAGPGGVPAAIAKASSLAKGAELDALTDRAAGVLFTIRVYEPMRALFGRTRKYASSSFGTTLSKVRRIDDKVDRGDPRTAWREATHWLVDLGWSKEAIWDDALARSWRDHPSGKSLVAYGHALLEDVLIATDVTVDGARSGPWRLTSMFSPEPVYVARDRGVAKVIGWPKQLDVVGAEILRAVARNDQATAFQLLDWVLQDLKSPSVTRMFGAVWSNQRTKEAASLAGALLAGTNVDAAIPILRACKSTEASITKACQLRLGAHLERAKTPKPIEELARARLAADPANAEATLMLIRALIAGRKLPEANRLLATRLAADPTDEDTRHAKAWALTFEGKFADAIQLYETTSWGAQVGFDLNEAAWLRLVVGQDLDKAVASARKAVDATSTERERGMALHTVSALEAELGNLTAANTAIQQAMSARFRIRPEPGDWYVYGRIAEQLGLSADAREAYRKVVPEPNQPSITAYDLAQRRLKLLRP